MQNRVKRTLHGLLGGWDLVVIEGMRATDIERLFDDVISTAILEIRASGMDLFTFAFYHDHESAAVSICADTKASSVRSVRGHNAFFLKRFAEAVARSDLRKAELFKANAGRSLSLGDFEMVNVARTDLGPIPVDADFYLQMIRAVRAREGEIVELAGDVESLLFCASSAKWEVGYVWPAAISGL